MQIQLNMVEGQEQIAELAGMADEVWHEYFSSILSAGQIDYMVEKFQSEPALTDQIQNKGYQYYFILEGKRPVGYTAVLEDAPQKRLFLSKLYLLKSWRGKGYASHVFEFLENLCTERGLSAIWLTVNRYNESTIAVYEKKGFTTVRTQVVDIGNGYVMDDFVMEKSIS